MKLLFAFLTGFCSGALTLLWFIGRSMGTAERPKPPARLSFSTPDGDFSGDFYPDPYQADLLKREEW